MRRRRRRRRRRQHAPDGSSCSDHHDCEERASARACCLRRISRRAAPACHSAMCHRESSDLGHPSSRCCPHAPARLCILRFRHARDGMGQYSKAVRRALVRRATGIAGRIGRRMAVWKMASNVEEHRCLTPPTNHCPRSPMCRGRGHAASFFAQDSHRWRCLHDGGQGWRGGGQGRARARVQGLGAGHERRRTRETPDK